MRALWTGLLALGLFGAPLAAPAAQTASSEVEIDAGRLRGSVAGDVLVFKGIPFAAPPVGDNRWRAPQPVAPWPGVHEATEFGHDCMQKPFPSDAAPLGQTPDEDCLYLNVWRPAAADKDKRPVVVWLYGGGYVNGGSSPAVYDGSAFARDDVVFVSVNYRLGRFGFFAHPALSAARDRSRDGAAAPLGNYGYMDQLAALEWVQRNIARFGGDPANVTLLGESAGGGSVLDLTASPAARGLFARAAVMSGGGRALMGRPHLLDEDRPGNPSAETLGVNFAKSVGIDGSGPEALAALRALPAERIVGDLNLATLFSPPAAAGPATYSGGPIVDGRLVTGTPEQVYGAGEQTGIPVLIGTTGADLSLSSAHTKSGLFTPFGANAARARALYDPNHAGSVQALNATIGMDRLMTEPARFIARRVAARGQPAYLYRFFYVPDTMRRRWPSAPHASDIPFAFETLEARYGAKVSAADRATAKALHGYMVNFAATGDPNGAGLPRWPTYTARSDQVMGFMQQGPVARPDPWRERLDLIRDSQPATVP